ncbi:MAG: carotenoid oxygenase [Alphaproteobacteria bacterium]|nr:carotenoid oxygenase [Alphaproteobacteria bacterium]
MKPFPALPYLSGNFAPLLVECDANDLVIEGEMPRDLSGALFRTGPNPQFPPLGNSHHWFLGDGMVHALFIDNGRVSYRNRWVRTHQFNEERAAGRRLYSSAFGGEAPDPSAAGKPRNVANTNIVPHAGKLFAIDEGSSPVAMDPRSLDTQGSWTFEGKYQGPMTAHPKIDAETGEMFFFGYMAAGPGSPDISFVVVDKHGKVTRSEMFKAPYASMVHDFAITDQHIIFPIYPATIDVQRIMKGGPVIAWDPDAGTHIGIMPRNGTMADIRWFKGPAAYAYHPLNAYSEGGKVVLDHMVYPRVPLFPNADGSRAPADIADQPARLERWTFDLSNNSDSYKREVLDDLATEFPRIDDRWTGLKHRHGYAGAITGAKLPGSPFDTIAHYDLKTGAREIWKPGAGNFVMEPVVAPRGPGEANGYVLTLVYRSETNLSDLVVLDAKNIAAGPVATAKLPVRVPFGFHGNWLAAAQDRA